MVVVGASASNASVFAVCPVPPFAIGSVPVTPVESGNPVQFVSVPDVGVPSTGVVRDGDVANTSEPEPVSSVTAAARFAELGVARNVATLVPRPDTPVLIGRPVQFVSVPDVGVPSTGVTNVGLVARTTLPVPVEVTHSGAVAPEFVASRWYAVPMPRRATAAEPVA